METLFKFIGIAVLALVGLAVLAIIGGVPTYFLWNWLMPAIFALKEITFWQAIGLNFLAAILFKSNVAVNKGN